MAKLDEITEVLTEELEGFKNSIKKMEELGRELNGSKTQMIISRTREEVSSLKQNQDNHFRDQRITVNQLVQEVSKSKIIPKWLLGLFCATAICTLTVLGYALFHINMVNDYQKEAYLKGKSETIQNILPFFDAYPDAKKDYKKWRSEQTANQEQR
ncbi:DUF6730 family protein [Flagellimonas sp. 2504JD1-5]